MDMFRDSNDHLYNIVGTRRCVEKDFSQSVRLISKLIASRAAESLSRSQLTSQFQLPTLVNTVFEFIR